MSIQMMLPWIGGIAALLTSLSYVPQVRKALPRGATQDLSLKTLGILTTGLSVWIVYGLLAGDWIIVLGNAVGAGLSGTVMLCKLRDIAAGRQKHRRLSANAK